MFKKKSLSLCLLFLSVFSNPLVARADSLKIDSSIDFKDQPLLLAVANTSSVNLKPKVVESWNNGYKLQLILSVNSTVKDWQAGFQLPDGHRLRAIYGALAAGERGEIALSGQSWNQTLYGGTQTEVILIVDTDQQNVDLSVYDNYSSTGVVANTSNNSNLSVASTVVHSWIGGYKLEVNITAKDAVKDWQLDFDLPSGYNIREIYNVKFAPNGDRYTLSGLSGWNNNLTKGQSIKGIFIIDGPEVVELAFGNNSQQDYVAYNPQPQPEPQPQSQLQPEVTPEPEPQPQPQNNTPTPQPTTTENYNFNGAVATNQQGKFRYGEVLQKNFLFWEANKSGYLPADHRLEWRGHATFNDGKDVGRDLTGGYYDAGDHILFGQPMSYSIAHLAWSGIEYKDAYRRSGQLDELLETVKWGTDWFLKAHETDAAGKTNKLWVQVGDGSDHHHWVPAEQIASKTARPSFAVDRNKPGSDVAAGYASALASASMLFRGVDDAYADKLLKNARQIYEFAETYQGKYSDSVPAANPFYTSWSGYWDELANGAVWLYRATGDRSYLTKGENYFKTKIGGLGNWAYATDDHSYSAAALLAKESSDPYFKDQFKRWIGYWVNGTTGVKYTPGGFAHRNNWSSAPLTLSSAWLAEWYHDKVEPNQAYSNFAKRQLDYLLGDNPRSYSYVVGFGKNYPERTHHRGSAYPVKLNGSTEKNTHVLWGALVGGLGQPDDFSHNDRRDDWVTNEVGTSYNAPLAAVAVQMYDNYGGDALSDAELNNLAGVNAYGTNLAKN